MTTIPGRRPSMRILLGRPSMRIAILQIVQIVIVIIKMNSDLVAPNIAVNRDFEQQNQSGRLAPYLRIKPT